jgi:hypothetical protein
MSNKNLFKEAIADAKAVREAALANAKAALEEALTPRLQSMLAAKLNEIEENMDEDTYEEGFVSPHDKDHSQTDFFMPEGEESLEEEFDISEILAELDEEDDLNEAKKKEEKEEKEEDEENEMPEDIESLKALIQDLISQEMGKEGGAEMHAEPDADNMGGPSDQDADNADEVPLDEEIDLEELLAELDKMGKDDDGKMEEIDIKGGLKKIGQFAKNVVQRQTNPKSLPYFLGRATKVDNNDRPIKQSKAEKQADWDSVNGDIEKLEDMGYVFTTSSSGAGLGGSTSGGFGEAQEMNEAIRTIKTLRNELNEVNLLNAKLLYVNKIFKAKNLTESQKLKVIASFDKATTTREAKVVYESLNSTLTTSAPKQAIKESLGFASRAAGVAPRKAIVESNDVIARMQKLANIIK